MKNVFLRPRSKFRETDFSSSHKRSSNHSSSYLDKMRKYFFNRKLCLTSIFFLIRLHFFSFKTRWNDAHSQRWTFLFGRLKITVLSICHKWTLLRPSRMKPKARRKTETKIRYVCVKAKLIYIRQSSVCFTIVKRTNTNVTYSPIVFFLLKEIQISSRHTRIFVSISFLMVENPQNSVRSQRSLRKMKINRKTVSLSLSKVFLRRSKLFSTFLSIRFSSICLTFIGRQFSIENNFSVDKPIDRRLKSVDQTRNGHWWTLKSDDVVQRSNDFRKSVGQIRWKETKSDRSN